MRKFCWKRWMKLISLSFIICLLSFSEVQAQVRFGIKGGIQVAQMELNASTFNKSNRMGFFVGPTLCISLPIPSLSIDVAAFYDQHDLKVDDSTIRQQRVVVPAHARLGMSIADEVGAFILAGPQLSFNVGDSFIKWEDTKKSLKQYIQQNTMLGLNVGFGAFFFGFEASVIYHIPFGRTGDFTWEQARSAFASETWEHATSSTNSWRLAIAYYF